MTKIILKKSPRQCAKALIELAGGQNQLAREMRVSQSTVWAWTKRKEGIPEKYIIPVYKLFNQALKIPIQLDDIRPDIYPANTIIIFNVGATSDGRGKGLGMGSKKGKGE